MARQEFKVKLESGGEGGKWTCLTVPFNVQQVFGTKTRVSVKGTINGLPYRSSIFPKGAGTHLMMVNKAMQKGAGVLAGDTVKVVMQADAEPRVVTIPTDFKKALAKNKKAKDAFKKFSCSHKKEWVDWINQAKKPETRARRIAKAVTTLLGR